MHKMKQFRLNLFTKGTLIDFECKIRINLIFLNISYSLCLSPSLINF